jgi:hypothetical protein
VLRLLEPQRTQRKEAQAGFSLLHFAFCTLPFDLFFLNGIGKASKMERDLGFDDHA